MGGVPARGEYSLTGHAEGNANGQPDESPDQGQTDEDEALVPSQSDNRSPAMS